MPIIDQYRLDAAPSGRAARVPIQSRAKATREKVITTAGETYAAIGYPDTVTAELCEDAGVAIGTLLFHFPFKQHLGRAVVRAQRQLFAETVAAARETAGDDPTAEFWSTIDALAELIATNPTARAGVRLTLEDSEALRLPTRDRYRGWLAYLVRIQTKATPSRTRAQAHDTAETLAAVLVGAFWISLTTSDCADLPARLRQLRPVLAEALRA